MPSALAVFSTGQSKKLRARRGHAEGAANRARPPAAGEQFRRIDAQADARDGFVAGDRRFEKSPAAAAMFLGHREQRGNDHARRCKSPRRRECRPARRNAPPSPSPARRRDRTRASSCRTASREHCHRLAGNRKIVRQLSRLQARTGKQATEGIENVEFRRVDDFGGNSFDAERSNMTRQLFAKSLFSHGRQRHLSIRLRARSPAQDQRPCRCRCERRYLRLGSWQSFDPIPLSSPPRSPAARIHSPASCRRDKRVSSRPISSITAGPFKRSPALNPLRR